jgi:sortase A
VEENQVELNAQRGDAAKDARTIATTAAVATLLLGLLLAWLRGRPWHIRRHAAWWPKRG